MTIKSLRHGVVALLLTTSALIAGVVETPGPRTVKIQIQGMACPFCAYGVEKQLHHIRGVQSAQVNLGEGVALVAVKPGEKVSIDELREAVERAGFKAAQIQSLEEGLSTGKTTTVLGTVEKTDRGFTLIAEDGARYLLYDRIPEKGTEGLNPGTQQKLEEFARKKTKLRVEGRAHSHKDLPSGLLVEKLKVAL